MPVIANGGLDDAPLAERVLADGHADLVSLGHGALANPDWPRRLATGAPFEPFDPDLLRPEVTIENALRRRARLRPENGYWRKHAPASSSLVIALLAVPASAEAGTLLSVPAAGGRRPRSAASRARTSIRRAGARTAR